MFICWSLSAMLHRTGIDINDTQWVKENLIGKEIYLDRYTCTYYFCDRSAET